MEKKQYKLISFHGKQKIKDKYISRLKAHEAADEIIQGITWKNGKGCAIGCTLHDYSHSAYETELGIPSILANLEDRIFEGLSNEAAKKFPLAFLSAVPVGVDLSNVFKPFFIWLLTDKEEGVINCAKNKNTKKAIQSVSDLLSKSLTENVTAQEWEAVRRMARAAANAHADNSCAAAAAAAAADATAAYAAAAIDYAAKAHADRQKKYEKMSEKLIELLKASI